jgi:thiol-disulfide isomerase/thioredoxin
MQSHFTSPRKVSKPSLSRWHQLTWANRFSNEFTAARYYKLDVDNVADVAQELGIRAMPTFVLFKDGEKVGDVVGANPKALETAIKNLIKLSEPAEAKAEPEE